MIKSDVCIHLEWLNPMSASTENDNILSVHPLRVITSKISIRRLWVHRNKGKIWRIFGHVVRLKLYEEIFSLFTFEDDWFKAYYSDELYFTIRISFILFYKKTVMILHVIRHLRSPTVWNCIQHFNDFLAVEMTENTEFNITHAIQLR